MNEQVINFSPEKLEELKAQIMAQNPSLMCTAPCPNFSRQPIWGKQGEWTMYEHEEKTIKGMITFYLPSGRLEKAREIVGQAVIDRLEKQGIVCVFLPTHDSTTRQEYITFGK